VVYITTPAIPSCFVSFFSDPYSPFEISIFNYTSGYSRISYFEQGEIMYMQQVIGCIQ